MRLKAEHEETMMKLAAQNKDFEQMSKEFELLVKEKLEFEKNNENFKDQTVREIHYNRSQNYLVIVYEK